MEYQGRVVKTLFAPGTKSQHEAVLLETPGGQYVLRRQGGNPFQDPELERLVGKTVTVEGLVHGYTLIFSAWTEHPGDSCGMERGPT